MQQIQVPVLAGLSINDNNRRPEDARGRTRDLAQDAPVARPSRYGSFRHYTDNDEDEMKNCALSILVQVSTIIIAYILIVFRRQEFVSLS